MTAIYNALSKRRGHVVSTLPTGTPVYIVKAYFMMNPSDLELILRAHTRGMAFGLSYFDHWSVAPGDPLEQSHSVETVGTESCLALGERVLH